MNDLRRLLELKGDKAFTLRGEGGFCACFPDMGGRVFASVGSIMPHRLDLHRVAHPQADDFNNYGGNSLWPAPEGGPFGFNYRGDEWYVPPAINVQPFETVSADGAGLLIRKEITLVNRAGTEIATIMERELQLADAPAIFGQYAPEYSLAYATGDAFIIKGDISTERGLLAAWTLEQFAATAETTAFCAVGNPHEAINFDYYEHPGDRISYYSRGFTYRTDGCKAGQIGIKKSADALFIGFFDMERKLLCLRWNLGGSQGLRFDMADNDQPRGVYAAADNYSIFNSAPEMTAFELETSGAVHVENGLLRASRLRSMTAMALFRNADSIQNFLEDYLY